MIAQSEFDGMRVFRSYTDGLLVLMVILVNRLVQIEPLPLRVQQPMREIEGEVLREDEEDQLLGQGGRIRKRGDISGPRYLPVV